MPVYRVDILCRGRCLTPGARLFFQQEHEGCFETNFDVWLVRGGGRTIVVDTGFLELARMNAHRPPDKMQRRENRSPTNSRPAAFGPDDVDTVILTHLHLDHCSGLPLFSKARIVMQHRVWQRAVAPDHPGITRLRFCPRDIYASILTDAWDRVDFVHGDAEICPGIRVHRLGGHTAGLQAATVESGNGRVVLCCHAASLSRSIEMMTPPALTTNSGEAFRAPEWARARDGLMLPGRDPEALRHYPDGRVI